MKKTTQLMEELNGSDDINSFLSNNKDSLDRQDFARYLCELVKKKKMRNIFYFICRRRAARTDDAAGAGGGRALPALDRLVASGVQGGYPGKCGCID